MVKENKLTVRNELTEFLLYTTPDGKVKVEIFFHNENIWLTQKRMAELFGVQRPAITKHLNNIFKEGELEKNSVSSILEHFAISGQTAAEYDKFNKIQKIESDFDREMKKF